jgi:hypothetical protein
MRASLAALALSLAALSSARADTVTARPVGLEEVPVVLTGAKGIFKASINRARTEISWELRYAGLEGSATQAHVHIGKALTNGGVVLFACSNGTPPPPANIPKPQPCPEKAGTISGKWTVADVVEVVAQGVSGPDALESIIDAMRENLAYFNIHTSTSPGGEIRGQIR